MFNTVLCYYPTVRERLHWLLSSDDGNMVKSERLLLLIATMCGKRPSMTNM